MSGDPAAEGALGALAPALAGQVGARVALLADALRADRGQALRRLALETQDGAIDGRLEARRVLAILSTEVPRERGMVWLAAVPRHRSGWSAPPALKDRLARLASSRRAMQAAAEIAEIDAALGGEPWPG